MHKTTTAPTKRGALSTGRREVAAPVLEEEEAVEEEEELPVAVALPEPGVAVPVEIPPAFWDPSPVRPGPVPAPLVM